MPQPCIGGVAPHHRLHRRERLLLRASLQRRRARLQHCIRLAGRGGVLQQLQGIGFGGLGHEGGPIGSASGRRLKVTRIFSLIGAFTFDRLT